MKRVEALSERNYKIYKEYKKGSSNGRSVDDLAYTYNLSNSRIYQIIAEVVHYINSPLIKSYDQDGLKTCYSGEIISKCSRDCYVLYKIALAMLIDSIKEKDVIKVLYAGKIENIKLRVDIGGWIKERTGRRNKRKGLVSELLNLRIYINSWNSIILQINFGICDIDMQVFESVEIKKNELVFSFTDKAKAYFICVLAMHELMLEYK